MKEHTEIIDGKEVTVKVYAPKPDPKKTTARNKRAKCGRAAAIKAANIKKAQEKKAKTWAEELDKLERMSEEAQP